MLYKIKVYLGERNSRSLEVNPLDPKGDLIPFMNQYTRWTFVTTQDRTVINPEEGFCQYSSCLYTDGSSWGISEIDAFLPRRDVEIIGNFRIHQRACRSIPIYSKPGTFGLPASFSTDLVETHFPLAPIYINVFIGGQAYEYNQDTGCLELNREVPDKSAKVKKHVQRRQQAIERAIELRKEGLSSDEICQRMGISYQTYINYTKQRGQQLLQKAESRKGLGTMPLPVLTRMMA